MKKLMLGLLVSPLFVACCQNSPAPVDKEAVVVENILERRSVRDYTDQEVTAEQLETIMKCAINAPSAMNKQPWEVRVLTDADLLGKLRAINEKATYNSPVVIFIAADKDNRFSQFDCGLLTQNILLAAESMDLGTVVVGSAVPVLQTEEGQEILDALGFSEGYELIMGICLGHKNDRPEARPRDKSKVAYIK